MNCVRCGKELVEGVDNTETTKRTLPPCCANHVLSVRNEAGKRYSMWPHHFVGGWMWNGWEWHPVATYRPKEEK